MAHDIFISHSSKDKTVADAACACLEARGLRCWIAPRDIVAGAEWGASIIDGIQGSKAMILILSAHSNISSQVLREIERAANRSIPILPFRIEEVTLSKSLEYFLSSAHWLDAYHGELRHNLEKLANNVAVVIEKQDAVRPLVGPGPQTAASPADGVLREGQCKACGTVTSDFTKKFCRNPQCGASLRVACLKCDTQIPVWDGVCGECGGNQPSLLDARRDVLSAKRTEAQRLLSTLLFDDAIDLAREVLGESHSELVEYAAWATEFVATAASDRDFHRASAAERLQNAWTHVSAFDYLAAIESIEMIPGQLRDAAAMALLDKCRTLHSDSEKLIAEINRRVDCKQINGLLPLVERAVVLRGDRQDLAKVRRQLEERRDKRVAKARAAFEAGNARAAAATLEELSAEERGDTEVLYQAVLRAVHLEDSLIAFVKEAKKDGPIDVNEAHEVIRLGDECLAVNPANREVSRLVAQARQVSEDHLRQFQGIPRHNGSLRSDTSLATKVLVVAPFIWLCVSGLLYLLFGLSWWAALALPLVAVVVLGFVLSACASDAR